MRTAASISSSHEKATLLLDVVRTQSLSPGEPTAPARRGSGNLVVARSESRPCRTRAIRASRPLKRFSLDGLTESCHPPCGLAPGCIILGVETASSLRSTPARRWLHPEPGAFRYRSLQACKTGDGPTDALCGTLRVFENRETREGRTIDLKIVVLPGLGTDAQPDPLFFLAGGPGQGAAKMAKQLSEVFRRVQTQRDIVLVDQRGTGMSNPLNCEADQDSLAALDERDEVALERLRHCLSGLDADPRLYTTTIAMDDLDDVRRHLGYDRDQSLRRLVWHPGRAGLSAPTRRPRPLGCPGRCGPARHAAAIVLRA